jgi:putative PIN family toxin of toxin-antitoxin system
VARGAPARNRPTVRIVLDADVVVSALLWRGAPYHLLRAVRSHEDVRFFTSTVLMAEVLSRPFAAKRLALLNRTALTIIADFLVAADIVVPSATPRVVIPDVDDDHVIAACVAAEADILVSGDRHLLTIGHHLGTRVVTPAAALHLIAIP